MLLSLSIKNVALISDAEITFCNGLNILSGETGAGKSVILDSINFVLGSKADKTMIRHGEQFCLVSCLFTDYPSEVGHILDEYDIENMGEIVIKRKFDLNGNGYIKLNGENVTATMLRRITSLLVDVHGQSEHFSLLSKSKQLECIDNGADVSGIKENLASTVSKIKDIETKLYALGGDPDERAKRLEILEYQINEIESAEIFEGEKEQLIAQKNKIVNLEKLFNGLNGAYSSLNEENGAIDLLSSVEQYLKPLNDFDVQYNKIYERIRSAREEIIDIAECINDNIDGLDGENLNVDDIEQRLDIYRNFNKKYGASVEEINAFLNKAKAERDYLLEFDKNTEQLLSEKRSLCDEAYNLSLSLSQKRKDFANILCKRVEEKLSQLAMKNARFMVEFADIPEKQLISSFSSNGLDKIEFMFSANAGEPIKPLSKIISGGEMSRFMLALKTQAKSLCDTYMFDEIDAGISGATAAVVAKHFAEISSAKQIIAISHLAQITAMSDGAFLIQKVEENGKTYTRILNLDETQKRNEIIRLIGGSVDDQTAIKHAENLINEAINYKKNL